MAWSHSSDGKFSVKSGYHCWYNSIISCTTQRDGWQQLWTLDIPWKVKVFLWRFGQNNIHVRN